VAIVAEITKLRCDRLPYQDFGRAGHRSFAADSPHSHVQNVAGRKPELAATMFAKACYYVLVDRTRKREVLMNVSLTPEFEKFVDGKVESGLYNNASEVIREGLRLLKEHDEIRMKWREQVERGWLQAQAGQVVDGEEVFRKADERIKQRGRKRA
jgi:antitoxin ParD1/3/4